MTEENGIDDEKNVKTLIERKIANGEALTTAEINTLLTAMSSGLFGGRKLSFRDQCAAFGASYGGAANKVLTLAFNISPTTASNIAGCLEQDPSPTRTDLKMEDGQVTEYHWEEDHNKRRNPNRSRRYEAVAREFEALGVEEFNRRYMTPDVFHRIAKARSQLRAERAGRAVKPPREKDLSRMSTKQINEWYALHPDQDPRNQERGQ